MHADGAPDSMSIHGQVHRVVLTACNLDAFLQRATMARQALVDVLNELVATGDLVCEAPARAVDVRDTDNRGEAELHILLEVYWHKGPIEGSKDWKDFLEVVGLRFEQIGATITPMGARCIVVVRPAIEERPYAKLEVATSRFTPKPVPRLLDALYYTTQKEGAIVVSPYAAFVERSVDSPLPHVEPMWNHLLQYASVRCIVTTELFAAHLTRQRRMKALLVEEHNELRRFTTETTQRGIALPNRGVAVWFCTAEPCGNGSHPTLQSLCDAMQLFAAGEVPRTTQLPPRILSYLEHSNEPARTAMVARFSHAWRLEDALKLHQYYNVKRPECKAHALVVWPKIDKTSGEFSTHVHLIPLDHLLRVSSSVVDLQYELQQGFLNASLPPHVKKCFADATRDDLKHDHYRRYLLRTLAQFNAIYREEDDVRVDPRARLVEIGHGVLHPNSHIPVLVEYATPMILLVTETKAPLVKEHLQRYDSRAQGLRVTEDMLTGPMGTSFETLGDEVGLWVAYYEVKAAETHPRTAPLCATSDAPTPVVRSAYRSTCAKVTTQLLGSVTLELRNDEAFLEGIYTDRAQLQHVNNAWKRALQSLRNIYQTPIKQYVPPPLEYDAIERSTRVIDAIRSPVVDECLKTLLKQTSHLTDRAESVETLFETLAKLASERRVVDDKTVETVAANMMHNATRRTHTKRKREALTLEQIQQAWPSLEWNHSAPYTLQPTPDGSGGGSDEADEADGAYGAFRRSLASKHSIFWAVEQDALSHTLRTYRCDEGVWSFCPEDEILLAPFKQRAPKLVVYAIQYTEDAHGDRRLYTRLLLDPTTPTDPQK